MGSRLKRWRAQVAGKLARLLHESPRLKSVQFSYEKAGLTVPGEPIPWNADTILVEALVEFAADAEALTTELQLFRPGVGFLRPAVLTPHGEPNVYRALFWLAPLPGPELVRLYWRSRLLAQLALPHLSAQAFLQNLRLESPAVLARLGPYEVTCATLVEGQCSGLTTCGILKSPTSLLPMVDWGIGVELAEPGTGESRRIPVHLTGAQVAARQAVVSVALPEWSGKAGTWSASWTVAGRQLARHEFRVISGKAFQQSLYVADGRSTWRVPLEIPPEPPTAPRSVLSGPCPRIRIASREPGIAALCSLEVEVQSKDPAAPPQRMREEVLVTDAPPLCLPMEVALGGGPEVEAFELSSRGQFLGSFSWSPAPVATLTSEGGFRAPQDFEWTPNAESELHKRLCRLAGIP